MVNEWTEIRKELNDKVIESKLGEQVTQEDPTLKTLQKIQKSLVKTQVDNFGEPVRNVSTGKEVQTLLSDLIENVLQNVTITNPNSGPAQILGQLQNLNISLFKQQNLNVNTNKELKNLKNDLEAKSGLQKDLALEYITE